MKTNKGKVEDVRAEEFRRNREIREDNLIELEASLKQRQSKIALDEELLALRKKWPISAYAEVEPKVAYQQQEDWLAYAKKVQCEVLQQNIDNDKRILAKEMRGFEVEKKRLELINKGVEAWNMSDNQVLNQQ